MFKPQRLIPAHAGKTECPCRKMAQDAAHPRSRGENPSSLRTESFKPGSSPLTRGKPTRWPWATSLPGLIPAHAGKTQPSGSAPCLPTAHPRSRGENWIPFHRSSAPAGSSPLTRGKLGGDLHARLDVGLIPAHAGKTVRAARVRSAWRAHPRSRGENRCVVSRC